ncbi:TPA: HAD family hydrolase [Burkholderia cenocepacia]|uniref:HAD family hydrolase n=8 Tax=Burkholderia cenocepacia TaxID=95486 RepID=UPI0011782DBB|nr:HAD family hydrolase [Burkholderia cenocepacia]MDN7682560.1 HAD family hydrolase [Burkholderia cenocepacia]
MWDTLLRRDCHPEFAKLATALHVFLDPSIGVSCHYETAWDIYRRRVEQEMLLADRARAAGKDNEYEIVEVLRQWLTQIVDRPYDDSLPSRLADFELGFELRHTYPDPTIRDVSEQYPAETTLFLSDFYMSADRLSTLLHHHGIDTFVPGGLSSCDVGINKRSGKFFHYVEDLYRVMPNEHVHIGDNLTSDRDVPHALGINAVHFQPEAEHAKRLARESVFEDRGELFRKIQAEVKVAASGYQFAHEQSAEREAAFSAGIQSSVLVIGFCLYVAENVLSGGLKSLYFFSREGEFFVRVWNALFPSGQHAGHTLPHASLLEVSRLSTFCASLREVTPSEMRRIWNLYTTHSLEALLKSLGLEPRSFAELAAKHQLPLTETIQRPWEDGRVKRLFDDPQFVHQITEKIHADRRALLAYLATQGLRDDGSVVSVVDIGWRGTIQDNLAWLLPSVQFQGQYLGLQMFLNEQPANTHKQAFGPNANETLEHCHLLDAVSPLEMLFSSPLGSVSGYRMNDDGTGAVAFRSESDMEHASSKNFVESFQDGVVEAAKVWARYVETCAIAASELRDPALATWTRLIERPHETLVDAYSALNQNDVFGAGQFVSKRATPGVGKLLWGIVSRDARREVIMYVRQTQWTAGIWARRDLTLGNRLALVMVLRLAKGYKRFMQRRTAQNRTHSRLAKERPGSSDGRT